MEEFIFSSHELIITLGNKISILIDESKSDEWHRFINENTDYAKKYSCTHLGVMSTDTYYVLKQMRVYERLFLDEYIGQYIHTWLYTHYTFSNEEELQEKTQRLISDILNEMCRIYEYPLLNDAIASPGYSEEEYTCLLEFLGNEKNYEIHSKGKPLSIREESKYTQIIPTVRVRALVADFEIVEIARKYNVRIPADVICKSSTLYSVRILRPFPVEDYNLVRLYPNAAYVSVKREYFKMPGVIRVRRDTPDIIMASQLQSFLYVNKVETLPLLNTTWSSRERWTPYENPLSITYV